MCRRSGAEGRARTALSERSESAPKGAARSRHDEDLAVALWVGEVGERAGYPVEADFAGDERRHVHLALGDRAQALGELHRVVAEHELDAQLLADAVER